MSVEAKLRERRRSLPDVAAPIASYVPAVRTGNLVIVSGQLPLTAGKLLAVGKVPSKVTIDQAHEAAAQCVLNALAAVKALIGDLDQIRRIVRVGVFVQSEDTFVEQAQVANGASELLEELFGENGRHARAAVGVNALPKNATVEVELTVEVDA